MQPNSGAVSSTEAIVEYSYQRALRRLSDAMVNGSEPQTGDLQLVMLIAVRQELRGLRQSVDIRLGPGADDGPAGGASRPVMDRVKTWGPSAGVGAGFGAAVVYAVQEVIKLVGR